jgi:hypothetical protein
MPWHLTLIADAQGPSRSLKVLFWPLHQQVRRVESDTAAFSESNNKNLAAIKES